MISDSRKNKRYITKEYICPHCNSKEKFVVKENYEDEFIFDKKAYSHDCYCSKCNEYNSIYIDIETEQMYISRKEYYLAFPDRYDLKKYLKFLVDRIDYIRVETNRILDEFDYKLEKDLKEKLKDLNSVSNFRSLDIYCLIQELINDKNDEEYEIDIKKIKNE